MLPQQVRDRPDQVGVHVVLWLGQVVQALLPQLYEGLLPFPGRLPVTQLHVAVQHLQPEIHVCVLPTGDINIMNE